MKRYRIVPSYLHNGRANDLHWHLESKRVGLIGLLTGWEYETCSYTKEDLIRVIKHLESGISTVTVTRGENS